MYNGLVLNPAYAGSQQQFSLAALYRDQWLNVEGAPSFQMISTHTPAFSNTIGLGLLLSHEQIGVHKEYSAYFTFAYKIKLNFGYLSLGVLGGAAVKNSDYARLVLLQQEDDLLSIRSNSTAPNFGVGIYFYNSTFYAGLSSPYLLNERRIDIRENVSTTIINDVRSYYLTTGFLIGDERSILFNPSFLLRLRENSPIAGDVNTNVIFYKRLLLGASYRVASSIVFLSQLILNENFRMMYSYDFATQSQLSSRVSGTHEIMLNYRVSIRGLTRDPHCSAYF